MDKVEKLEIRCTDCGTWFNYPIHFGEMESFNTSTMMENTGQCPNCNKMVSCNKENMRVRYTDSGFSGIDTI